MLCKHVIDILANNNLIALLGFASCNITFILDKVTESLGLKFVTLCVKLKDLESEDTLCVTIFLVFVVLAELYLLHISPSIEL